MVGRLAAAKLGSSEDEIAIGKSIEFEDVRGTSVEDSLPGALLMSLRFGAGCPIFKLHQSGKTLVCGVCSIAQWFTYGS